ncbi:MAG: hypothetical protein LBE83_08330 [Propionibacteriaceae bacterium]|jgi:succinate-acetate transporter protein|nr:hypothetical protein [Propionibacteriaceae bacterium]
MTKEGANTAAAAPQWANPTAAGMVALAVACFSHAANFAGLVNAGALALLGCWLLGGFVVQLIVALLDLKSNNTAGGNTFMFFAAFFMLAGGLEMFFKSGAIKIAEGVPLDTRIDGFAWLALTLVLWTWTPAFVSFKYKKFNLLSIIILALDVALPVITFVDFKFLDPATQADTISFLKLIAAIFLAIAGIFGVYLSATLVVNTTYGKKVYPIIGK